MDASHAASKFLTGHLEVFISNACFTVSFVSCKWTINQSKISGRSRNFEGGGMKIKFLRLAVINFMTMFHKSERGGGIWGTRGAWKLSFYVWQSSISWLCSTKVSGGGGSGGLGDHTSPRYGSFTPNDLLQTVWSDCKQLGAAPIASNSLKPVWSDSRGQLY